MRNHIARMGMSIELGHYNIYRQKCLEGEIEMQARCIPDDERKRLEREASMSDNIERCVVPIVACYDQY
jgi:hypothetical protein